jgi:arginase family enzyme
MGFALVSLKKVERKMKTKSPEDADLIVQKLPSDMGIHRIDRKGTLKAPEKILDDFGFDQTVLVDEVFPDEFDLENNHRRIEFNTDEMLDYDKQILSIGGDHSVSFGVIKALKRENPDMQLVWLDSHMDLKEKVGNHISHDVVVLELLKHGFSDDEIWFVGVTRIDDDEKDFLKNSDFNIYRSDEFKKFLREFNSNEQPVYLSTDIDVLKEEKAPGTGYTDGELSLEQVKEIIKEVEPDYADLVEVAPPFDKNGKTVENAREIISLLATELSK